MKSEFIRIHLLQIGLLLLTTIKVRVGPALGFAPILTLLLKIKKNFHTLLLLKLITIATLKLVSPYRNLILQLGISEPIGGKNSSKVLIFQKLT